MGKQTWETEINILEAVVMVDAVATVALAFYGISFEIRLAFDLGVLIGAVVVYFMIREGRIKEFKPG